jgi:DnaJ-class molecular chaperone
MPQPSKIVAQVDETTGLTAVIVLEEPCATCGGKGSVPREASLGLAAGEQGCPKCFGSGLVTTLNGEALLQFLARYGS